MSPILVHGHRGARAMRPENTMAAFAYAIEVGAHYLELDLAATKDDVLMAAHDLVLNPKICRSPGGPTVIRELTLAELRKWDCGSLRHARFPRQAPVPGAGIPTLNEVFEFARNAPVQFDIEPKFSPAHPEYTPSPERFAELLLEMVRRHGLECRVVVQSFDFRILHAMRALVPEIRRAALAHFGSWDFVDVARRAKATIIAPERRMVSARKVRAAHEAGIQVVPWTANRPAEWKRLIRAGVDGIITDDPAGLLSYLAASSAPDSKSGR